MIISRTPFRISFFGGGTDYPAYYKEHGGEVLSSTIDKYCHIFVRPLPPYFDYHYRIRYTKMEYAKTLDDIEHPSVRECLRLMDLGHGVELLHSGDIPAMSGTGSSSAFTAGLLRALHHMKGQEIDKYELAEMAIHVEQDLIGEYVGSQDQVAAAYGGLNHIEFGGSDGIDINPLALQTHKLNELQDCLHFCFTGVSRESFRIAKSIIDNTRDRLTELKTMKEMVQEALSILKGPVENYDDFGRLLNESWQMKKTLSNKISSDHFDDIYDKALDCGALGGKLCGAGGGGFFLFYIPKENRERFDRDFCECFPVPIKLNTKGSHVISLG
ncbi:kinase [Pseudodesulfovibrio sp. zrk46]|uniref:GHMP family kinase ATP-binding protein n=1 Tax=Pseudodesulfovibrio sp. zrk46 TaxID=2725288 RepID=UPI001448A61B|nr:kinase [Pseudodesulfovibrio sp. zrk46]QJB55737.1 kinase [Pseudodesulfovibrio sp. zrk46]